MKASSRTTVFLGDFFWGVLAFVVVRLMPIVTGLHQDIRPFVLTTFVAFSTSAFYRAGKRLTGSWIAFSLVASAGLLLGIAVNRLGMSLTAKPFFILFVICVTLGAGVGTGLRVVAVRRSPLYAVIGGCFVVATIATFAFKTIPDWLDRNAYQSVSQTIQPFTIQSLTGQTITAQQLQGHVTVLSFWATWCLPCQAELPRLQAVADRYRNNSQVSFLAVASGTEGDNADKVRSYLARKHLVLPVAIDSLDGDAPGSAAKSLGVPNLPALYILDREGRLRVIHLGYEASENLESSLPRQIESLL